MLYFDRLMRTPGKIRQLLALAIVAAVVVLAVVIYMRLPIRRQPAPTSPSPGRSVDLTLKGIRFTETSKGATRWTLLAERAEYDTAHSLVNLFGVRLSLSAGGSIGELVLNAARADYNTSTKDVALSGGVKATSSTGMEFSTANARFVAAKGVVTSSDRVRFSDSRLTVEGTGMEYQVEQAKLHLKNDVTATVKGGLAK